MLIKEIKRPWLKNRKTFGGPGYKSDTYYQTSSWKLIRERHRQGSTIIDGRTVSNLLCVMCFQKGRIIPGEVCDHIVSRMDGGKDELTNFQTLCAGCHATKTNLDRIKRIGKKTLAQSLAQV